MLVAPLLHRRALDLAVEIMRIDRLEQMPVKASAPAPL